MYLVAAVLEQADQQDSHDHYDGDEDSSIDQSKTKRLNTTGGLALIKWKVVTEMMKMYNVHVISVFTCTTLLSIVCFFCSLSLNRSIGEKAFMVICLLTCRYVHTCTWVNIPQ